MSAPFRCAACALALLLTSCGTLKAYEGASLAPARAARIAPAAEEPVRVLILSVDGYEPGLFQDVVEVPPGPHRVEVRLLFDVAGRRLTVHRQLEFASRPGARYRVHGDWFLHGPRVRITDAAGDLVAELTTGPGDRLPAVGAR